MKNTQVTDMQAFGARLGQERRHKGLTEQRDVLKRDVATAMGVSESTVGRWENGEAIPRDAVLTKLAEYFGVTRQWLRYGAEPRIAETRGRLVPDPRVKQAAKGASAKSREA